MISAFRFLSLLILLISVCSVGGVFATWKYATFGPSPNDIQISVPINDFEYKAEEILPGGDNINAELGKDHHELIMLILNERDKGYGLNYSNNVVLHQYLKRQEVVYSNQKVSGGNLKFIIDPKNNTHGLYYCIQKISDTEYHAYTYASDYLESASRTGEEILVYKTLLIKTDDWDATFSYEGYAKVKSLSNLGVSSDPNTTPYSIDVSTWHK